MFFHLPARKLKLDLSRQAVPISVHRKLIEETLSDQWPPDFEHTRPLMWVSQPKDQIRRIFRFQAMKGFTWSAHWGISVDFVPVVRDGSLSWKRTAKTAAADLTIDPIDDWGYIPNWCAFVANDSALKVRKVALATLKAAKSDWLEFCSLSDVANCFERRSKKKFRRFGLQNYVQTDLAWGLVLIALGQVQEGERHLERFCKEFEIREDDRVLLLSVIAARDAGIQGVNSAPPSSPSV